MKRQITVRKCNKSDCLHKVAELIYHTDPYIYPAAFEHIENAIKLFEELIEDEHGIFSKKNIYLAIYDDEIVGINIVLTDNNYNKIKQDFINRQVNLPNLNDVCLAYFNKMSDINFLENPYILCLCVDKNHRNKKIGSLLLEQIIKDTGHKDISLHVLKYCDSIDKTLTSPAIKLYKNYGFEVIKEEKGFALFPNDIPDCFFMTRKSSI